MFASSCFQEFFLVPLFWCLLFFYSAKGWNTWFFKLFLHQFSCWLVHCILLFLLLPDSIDFWGFIGKTLTETKFGSFFVGDFCNTCNVSSTFQMKPCSLHFCFLHFILILFYKVNMPLLHSWCKKNLLLLELFFFRQHTFCQFWHHLGIFFGSDGRVCFALLTAFRLPSSVL